MHANKRKTEIGKRTHVTRHSRHKYSYILVAKSMRNLKMIVLKETGIESKLLNHLQQSWHHSLWSLVENDLSNNVKPNM